MLRPIKKGQRLGKGRDFVYIESRDLPSIHSCQASHLPPAFTAPVPIGCNLDLCPGNSVGAAIEGDSR